jgi:hypothetical protein
LCEIINQMKTKIIWVVMFMILATTNFAQNPFNNGGFETWVDKGDYQEPQYWYTLNSLVAFGYDQGSVSTTDAHSGANAAKLTSQSSQFQDIPGLLASGPVLSPSGDVDFSQIKFAFLSRPKSLVFYYKYAPADGDSCNFYMAFTKWNTSTQQTDTIGEASFQKGDSVNDYTKVEVDIDYYSSAQPDSAFMIITSSIDGFNPLAGSVLFIDDLAITYNTGVNNTYIIDVVTTYPNPVKDVLHITTKSKGGLKVRLTTLSGIEMLNFTTQKSESEIDLSGFSNGMYLFEITTDEGISIQKIIKN